MIRMEMGVSTEINLFVAIWYWRNQYEFMVPAEKNN